MKKRFTFLDKIIRFFLVSTSLFFMQGQSIFAQYPVPANEDTVNFARGVQRTMQLLATSTPTNKKTVKILVYGQSISHGVWWLQVREDLKKRFPNANIIMENKAIGGFSSKDLFRPFINDVLPFNYDLILFHVYGSQWTYDSIVRNVRTYTTAEMALQNDHGRKGSDSWADQMSYTILPNFAQKYKLEMMDVRTPWTQYMDDNNFSMNDLTADGVHLNDRGNYLIGTLISRHLAYKPKFKSDPYELLKIYEVGKDVNFSNSRLEMEFEGSRVEFVTDVQAVNPAQVRVTIDNKRPTEILGCSYHLRANDSTEVPQYYENHPQNKAKRIDWPWNVGTILRVRRGAVLVNNEDWTVTINNLVTTSNGCRFNFTLEGSVTGNDGSGSVTMVKRSGDSSLYGWVGTSPAFVSNSKRVVISSNDWYIPQALENNQPKVSPIVNGYKIKWRSKVEATTLYMAQLPKDPSIEETKVIAHGLPKGNHSMTLEVIGGGYHSIKYIKVYNPYYDRPDPIASTEENSASESMITLYPNPATNNINIQLQEYADKEVKIEVFNMVGNFIESFKNTGNGQLSMNTSQLLPGMYYMNIDLGNGKVVNRKFNIVR